MIQGTDEELKNRKQLMLNMGDVCKKIQLFYIKEHMRTRFYSELGYGEKLEQVRMMERFAEVIWNFMWTGQWEENWEFTVREVSYRNTMEEIEEIVQDGVQSFHKQFRMVTPWMRKEMLIIASQVKAFIVMNTENQDLIRWMETEELHRLDYVSACNPQANAAMCDLLILRRTEQVPKSRTMDKCVEIIRQKLERKAGMRLLNDPFTMRMAAAICYYGEGGSLAYMERFLDTLLKDESKRAYWYERARLEFLAQMQRDAMQSEENSRMAYLMFKKVILTVRMNLVGQGLLDKCHGLLKYHLWKLRGLLEDKTARGLWNAELQKGYKKIS